MARYVVRDMTIVVLELYWCPRSRQRETGVASDEYPPQLTDSTTAITFYVDSLDRL